MSEQRPETSRLYDRDAAINFYQDRFARGYMDEWPVEKKRRVLEVVRGLGLPEDGRALDFGCGNGVFTDVIRQALPRGWKVSGTDLSRRAIENAARRYPECEFFAHDSVPRSGNGFDFVFTHHVLEHVFDLDQTLDDLIGRMTYKSAMLHILPCGNPGSLEHQICLLRRDGIDRQLEDRFFFEDEGHVRRLDTSRLCALMERRGYQLAVDYYANHYHGAIDWITRSGPGFVRMLTDPSRAVDERSARLLRRLRYELYALCGLRYPAALVESRLGKRGRTMCDYALLAAVLPFYPLTKPMDSLLKRRALNEWNDRRTDRGGSEMYLFFTRG